MVVCPYINPSFAELSCGSSHQTEMGPDAAAQEYIMPLWGLAGLTAFLVPSVLQAAHMQDSYDILTSYGLDSKVTREGAHTGSERQGGGAQLCIRRVCSRYQQLSGDVPGEAGFTKSSGVYLQT